MGVKIFDLLAKTGSAVSNSESRRLLFGGAVFLNGNRLNLTGLSESEVDVKPGDVLKVGKRSVTITQKHLE